MRHTLCLCCRSCCCQLCCSDSRGRNRGRDRGRGRGRSLHRGWGWGWGWGGRGRGEEQRVRLGQSFPLPRQVVKVNLQPRRRHCRLSQRNGGVGQGKRSRRGMEVDGARRAGEGREWRKGQRGLERRVRILPGGLPPRVVAPVFSLVFVAPKLYPLVSRLGNNQSRRCRCRCCCWFWF